MLAVFSLLNDCVDRSNTALLNLLNMFYVLLSNAPKIQCNRHTAEYQHAE